MNVSLWPRGDSLVSGSRNQLMTYLAEGAWILYLIKHSSWKGQAGNSLTNEQSK